MKVTNAQSYNIVDEVHLNLYTALGS